MKKIENPYNLGLYNFIDVDFSRDELPFFVKKYTTSKKLKILELGVDSGRYLDMYYHYLKTRIDEVCLVDIWQTKQNDKYYSRLKGYSEKSFDRVKRKYGMNDHIRICQGTSMEWCKKFPDEYFDWIYIDADHTKEVVLQDITNWYPKLKKQGIISGHDVFADYKNKFEAWDDYNGYDVQGALKEYFGEETNRIYVTNESFYKTWIHIKNPIISANEAIDASVKHYEEKEMLRLLIQEALGTVKESLKNNTLLKPIVYLRHKLRG